MKYARHFLLALLVSGLMVIPGVAQSSSSSGQQSQQGAQSSSSDQNFIKKAAQDNLAEIQLAQLVQQKANDNNIKQMAQRVMSDHQQNQQQLQQIAQQQNVTLPTQPDAEHQRKYDKLSKLNGQQFDKTFVREQVKDHQKDVAMFQHESQNATDPAVKQYASQTLPTLQQHLQMAESSAQQLGVNTGESETSASNQQMK